MFLVSTTFIFFRQSTNIDEWLKKLFIMPLSKWFKPIEYRLNLTLDRNASVIKGRLQLNLLVLNKTNSILLHSGSSITIDENKIFVWSCDKSMYIICSANNF